MRKKNSTFEKLVLITHWQCDFNEMLVSHQTNKLRGLISKETVVLCRWGRETQNFGFIN